MRQRLGPSVPAVRKFWASMDSVGEIHDHSAAVNSNTSTIGGLYQGISFTILHGSPINTPPRKYPPLFRAAQPMARHNGVDTAMQKICTAAQFVLV